MTVGSELRAGVGNSAGTGTGPGTRAGAAAATGDATWVSAAGARIGRGDTGSLCGMCATAAVIGMTVPRVGSGWDSWPRSTAGATAGFAVRRLEFGLVWRLGTIAVVASAIGGSGCTSGGIAGARLTLFISRPETDPFGVRASSAWSGAPLKLFLVEAGTTRDERGAEVARSAAVWEACAPGSDAIRIET